MTALICCWFILFSQSSASVHKYLDLQCKTLIQVTDDKAGLDSVKIVSKPDNSSSLIVYISSKLEAVKSDS